MRVLILHAYNADNAGDGLLVNETLGLIREALGPDTSLTLAASHPRTFTAVDAHIVNSKPNRTGYSLEYIRTLRNLDRFDLIVGVGGGYLRAGHLGESLKASVIHGPQLVAASRSSTPSLYMPQSVGPANSVVSRILKAQIRRIDNFYVRDDRSYDDYMDAGVIRTSDLAILTASAGERTSLSVDELPVLSVRPIRGRVSPLVVELARQCGKFDGYVQSNTAGNNDVDAMNSLGARRILPRESLMARNAESPVRVVVAVRLHAALMALRAGHYVIHLAYERKGFGAFNDLGLNAYVHNINRFEPAHVLRQMRSLLADEESRRRYAEDLDGSFCESAMRRDKLVNSIRLAAGIPLLGRTYEKENE